MFMNLLTRIVPSIPAIISTRLCASSYVQARRAGLWAYMQEKIIAYENTSHLGVEHQNLTQ